MCPLSNLNHRASAMNPPSSIIISSASTAQHTFSFMHHHSQLIHHTSHIIHHTSAINNQPSYVSRHPSFITHHPSPITHHPTETTLHPSAGSRQPSSSSIHHWFIVQDVCRCTHVTFCVHLVVHVLNIASARPGQFWVDHIHKFTRGCC